MSTSDFQLATTLFALGFPIDSLDSSDPRRIVFAFGGSTEDLNKAVSDYWKGKLKVEARNLLYHHRLLKSRVFDVSKK